MVSTRGLVILLILAAAAVGCSPGDPIARIEDQRVAHSTKLIHLLQDGAPSQRVRAAVAIGRIQSTSYVDALAAALGDDDREVRLAALFALGQMGLAEGAVIPPSAVDACLSALEDEDSEILLNALEALGKLAVPETAVTVSEYLSHPSPSIRREAAIALFRFRFVPTWRKVADTPPALPAEATSALIEALGDEDPEARWAAAYAFSRYGEPEASLRLATLVGDDDERVRLFAVRALGRSGDLTLADVVRRAMRDPSDRVRTEAVNALATLSGEERFPPALASDPSFHVRATLARALADCQGEGSAAMLQSLIEDESVAVRAAAVAATARQFGEAWADALERHLEDPDWRIRAAAAGAAASAGPKALDLVGRAMRDEDNRVRAAALGTLAAIDGGDDLINAALASDDLALRGTAVEILSGRDDSGKLERLAQAYDGSAGVEWIEIREAVVDAVADLDAAGPLLRRAAEADPASSVRRRARLALAGKGVRIAAEPERRGRVSPFLGTRFEEAPVVVLETSKGEITIRCLADEAPIHVASFVDLVEKGYYDGLIWHRVVSNFVIQGGDPRGDGWGGAGYTMRDEINSRRYVRGSVGMPKAGKDTGGGQLFITHILTPHLDGNYTIFGEVISGLEVVDRIEVGDEIVRARLR